MIVQQLVECYTHNAHCIQCVQKHEAKVEGESGHLGPDFLLI